MALVLVLEGDPGPIFRGPGCEAGPSQPSPCIESTRLTSVRQRGRALLAADSRLSEVSFICTSM